MILAAQKMLQLAATKLVWTVAQFYDITKDVSFVLIDLVYEF